MQVVFKTPGHLDLRSVTHFGINAKPNSNSPIGFFGTGLKYAIAVLLREGCSVTIHTNNASYAFSTESEDFRGKQFGMIYMKRLGGFFSLRPRDVEMSYTTELGKTWKLWQAFRELYSNTLDEAGETFLDEPYVEYRASEKALYTYIVVTGDSFVQEYYDKDKTFLPQASRNNSGQDVEHFEGSSNHVYYRGMRVQDLEKPSLYTYNILSPLELTEDRTAKYSSTVEQRIREHIISQANIPMLKAILKAPEGTYEQRFDFNGWHNTRASSNFISTARELRKTSTNSTIATYIERHDEQEAGPIPLEGPYVNHLLKGFEDSDFDLVDRLFQDYRSEVCLELHHLIHS